jgi:hypothetical protein
MKEKINRLHKRKWIRLGLIPLLLLTLWIGLTCLYILTFDTSLSVISYIHGKDSFKNVSYSKLLKGDKISGEFKAIEDNLGIVSIKFQTFIRPPYLKEDTLIFRLKEKSASKWYYQNYYRDGMVYEIPFFPFGFPKIADSKGKAYYFEVQSLSGNANNAVALSSRGQNLFSKYQISKSILLHDNREFAIFIVKKFVSALLTTDVRFSSFIYLLPLIFYMLWISPFKRFTVGPVVDLIIVKASGPSAPLLKFMRYLIVYNFHWIIITVVLVDIFMVQLTNDVVYLVIIPLWIIALKLHKMDCKKTFILAFVLLSISPIYLLMKDPSTAEKGASWGYMFLVAGMIQIIFELQVESKKVGIKAPKMIK